MLFWHLLGSRVVSSIHLCNYSSDFLRSQQLGDTSEPGIPSSRYSPGTSMRPCCNPGHTRVSWIGVVATLMALTIWRGSSPSPATYIRKTGIWRKWSLFSLGIVIKDQVSAKVTWEHRTKAGMEEWDAQRNPERAGCFDRRKHREGVKGMASEDGKSAAAVS